MQSVTCSVKQLERTCTTLFRVWDQVTLLAWFGCFCALVRALDHSHPFFTFFKSAPSTSFVHAIAKIRRSKSKSFRLIRSNQTSSIYFRLVKSCPAYLSKDVHCPPRFFYGIICERVIIDQFFQVVWSRVSIHRKQWDRLDQVGVGHLLSHATHFAFLSASPSSIGAVSPFQGQIVQQAKEAPKTDPHDAKVARSIGTSSR